MKRNILNLLILVLFAPSFAYAQESRGNEKTQTVVEKDIQSYLNQVAGYSVIYSGKAEEPYSLEFVDHPYLGSDKFSAGTLCYNGIIYTDVMLRYDTYKGGFLVRHPGLLFGVELKTERVNWAVLNGHKIVASKEVGWENTPDNGFLILLHEDVYPVIKVSKSVARNRKEGQIVEFYFKFENQYYICVDGVCHLLKNKKSVLDLFPDKKGELNQYANQKRLNFKGNPDTAYVELVKYYESLSR